MVPEGRLAAEMVPLIGTNGGGGTPSPRGGERSEAPPHDAEHVAIAVSSLTESMKRRLEKAREENRAASDHPSIHRVHPDVRKQDAAAYDPQFVSIGPYHHKKKGLEATEDLKWSYLHDLLGRSTSTSRQGEVQLREYIAEMWRHEERARGEYAAKVDLPRGAFVEMLVLDGCFLVELLIKRASGRITGPLTATQWNLPLLRRDLLLLENQIPFFVLQALFDTSHFPQNPPAAEPDGGSSTTTPGADLRTSCNTITIVGCSYQLINLALHYMKIKGPLLEKHKAAKHMLHLHHICLLGDCTTSNNQEQANPSCRFLIRSIRSCLVTWFYTPIALFLMCSLPWCRTKKYHNDYPREIPRAKELWEAGVRLKKKEEATTCQLNVSFSGTNGKMEIPSFSVEGHTNSLYRNLIAFEQCWPRGGKDKRFTSYAIFLSNVLEKEEDAALLKEKGILQSKLGSDEEAAKLFSKVVEGAALDYDNHYLREVYRDVRRYCYEDAHKWRAKLVHDYFKSPWTKLSFVATLLAFAIGITQVTFTIIRHVHSS